jgi:hypothetical protein
MLRFKQEKMIILKIILMRYLVTTTSMENCKLDFEIYKERLEKVFPTYTEEELKEYFVYYVEYLGALINIH